MPQGRPLDVAARTCSDIEYRYEITAKNDKLHVACWSVNLGSDPKETLIYQGALAGLADAKKEEVA
jgi:hypothetical protein